MLKWMWSSQCECNLIANIYHLFCLCNLNLMANHLITCCVDLKPQIIFFWFSRIFHSSLLCIWIKKNFKSLMTTKIQFVHNDRPCILLGTRYNLTIHQIQSEFRPFFFCDQTISTNKVYNRTSEDKFIQCYFFKIPWPFHILFHIFSEVFC